MHQNQTGSFVDVLTSLSNGKLDGHDLRHDQVNRLVATANCRLTPQQREEVKCFFVFQEAPSLSTRAAFTDAASAILENNPVFAAIVAS